MRIRPCRRPPLARVNPSADEHALTRQLIDTCNTGRPRGRPFRCVRRTAILKAGTWSDTRCLQPLLEVERRNLQVFGYGAKGMTLSMIESAVQLTGERISAHDIHRIIDIGRTTLEHPVELIAGIRTAVEAIAAQYGIVSITKGDLFHHESRTEKCGLADLFHRIEVVSEKDPPTYRRVLRELDVDAARVVIAGNSIRSDTEPVLALGGWGIMPCHLTWAHEAEHDLADDEPRMLQVEHAMQLSAALAQVEGKAAAAA